MDERIIKLALHNPIVGYVLNMQKHERLSDEESLRMMVIGLCEAYRAMSENLIISIERARR